MPSMAAAFSSYEILQPHALLDSSSTSFFSVQMGRRAANAASSSPFMTAGYSCSPEAAFPEIIPAASEMMSHDSCSSFESGTKLSSGGDSRGVLPHSPRGAAADQLHHESEAAGAPVKQTTAVKKRKCYRPSVRPASSIPVNNPKDTRKRRQKRSGGVVKGGEEEEEESPKPSSPPQQEPDLSGYIHVRARRGQATDSHSLAERVRREKISERMKLLQGLVPGCDKVTGKALMLDEIINYVQSLQNQVEFLSMKLASLNPIMYDFGLDLDEYSIVQPQKLEGMSPQMPSTLQPVCHIQPTEATTNYAIVDNSVPFLVHDLQGPSTVFSQGNGDFVMQEGDNGSLHHHQHQFNVCSFQ